MVGGEGDNSIHPYTYDTYDTYACECIWKDLVLVSKECRTGQWPMATGQWVWQQNGIVEGKTRALSAKQCLAKLFKYAN